jgi:hypothetical protein
MINEKVMLEQLLSETFFIPLNSGSLPLAKYSTNSDSGENPLK